MAEAKPFLTRLTKRDKVLLEKLAKKEGRSMANVLQMALREYAAARSVKASVKEVMG